MIKSHQKPMWYIFFIATEAVPQESVEQSCPSKDNTEQIAKLSGMVQGLEEALEDIKNDISLQVRCLGYFFKKNFCYFTRKLSQRGSKAVNFRTFSFRLISTQVSL